MRPGVTGVELNMIGKPLLATDQETVIVRSSGVLIGADGGEHRVRPCPIKEEAGMRRIRENWRSIGVTLAKQAETPLSNVLNRALKGWRELVFDAEVGHADFRIFQVI